MPLTKEVIFSYNLNPLQTVKLAEHSPLRGRITELTRHFPDGCDRLVHVAFGHGEVWVAPSSPNTYTSLNDATPTVRMEEPVVKNELLWAEMRNADAINPHAISIIATIVGEVE